MKKTENSQATALALAVYCKLKNIEYSNVKPKDIAEFNKLVLEIQKEVENYGK